MQLWLMLEDHFAGEVAARYDETLGRMGLSEVLGATVDLLAGLVGNGAALELAIGTGRVALPLAARALHVSGIELSPDMLAQLQTKPGGDAIPVVIGDIATTRVEGVFRLVYLVYNTIGNLETQDQQVACFANAAAHLEPGGCFVIEVGVPDLRRLVPTSCGAWADSWAHSRFEAFVGNHASTATADVALID